MKGPFSSYQEALDAALPGEEILVRDTRYFREEAWCVVSSQEADTTLNPYSLMNPWILWERVKGK